ncbi:MAG: hypothetical protein JWM02_2072 [Frankiales bacterium]|nr:hypothetical protein [Frankiales bacterium]
MSPTATVPAAGNSAGPHQLDLGADWTTYGGTAGRSSNVPAGPNPNRPNVAWQAALDGRVYASPLVVRGTVIAATENGSLYALSGQTGRVLWRRHLSDPVNGSALPCGNIDPLGITGTPVYDRATGLVFAVATQPGVRHVLYGVDARTGRIRLSRGVDVPGMQPATHLQRGALLLSGATVYISYGGNYGDCGQYQGRVVGVPTKGAGALRSFTVPTRREGGIWAASGPALLPGGDLLLTTGNGASTGGAWDHSDSVLRLSPTLRLLDGFAPRQWARENSLDADLGSMGPLLLPGAARALAAGKGGNVFLVDVGHLGAVGGQIASLSGCSGYGSGAVAASRAGVAAYLPCDGGLLQVRVQGNHLSRGWVSSVVGSPLVVGSTVWVVQQDGSLCGLDASTGRQKARLQVGGATRFAKPAVSGNALLLPTKRGITAVQLTTRPAR